MSIGPFRTAAQVDGVPRGASREIVDAIRDASQKSGVDFKYMLAKAQTESSFDPRAKARTSSASGLYQFMPGTWATTPYAHRSIWSARWQSAAARWMVVVANRSREWACR